MDSLERCGSEEKQYSCFDYGEASSASLGQVILTSFPEEIKQCVSFKGSCKIRCSSSGVSDWQQFKDRAFDLTSATRIVSKKLLVRYEFKEDIRRSFDSKIIVKWMMVNCESFEKVT